jgi:hypothetical protein
MELTDKNMKLTDKWITGFVDGDGCFSISNTKDGIRYSFVVSQNERSVDVLYALKSRFGCGSVCRSGGAMREYRVSAKAQLINTILPFFVKNPLQTTKIEKFKVFYEKLTGEPYEIPVDREICKDWLIGFIDAEGNFHTSMVDNYPRPQFSIGLALKDAEVLTRIEKFLNTGFVDEKHPTNKKPYKYYQISSLRGFLIIIEHCTTTSGRVLLRTKKRINFISFRQIIRIIERGEHLDQKGKDKINKLCNALKKK